MGSLLRSTRNTRALPTGDLRYIRSDFPGGLTTSEVQWLLQNNIVTIVDLREEKEYRASPCVLEAEPGFTYYHLPVTGGGDTPKSVEAVAATYLGMLDEQMEKIIGTILEAKTNVMYFCGAGKDRTGVVSAILLKRLGYSNQEIIKDYMETKENLIGFLTSYVKAHPEVDMNIIIPKEENIKKVLTALESRERACAETAALLSEKESAQEPLGSAREERQSLKFSMLFSPNARKNRNATCSFHLEPDNWWSFSASD